MKRIAQFIGGPMHGQYTSAEGLYYRVLTLFGKRGALVDYCDPWEMPDLREIVYEMEEWVSFGQCTTRHRHSPALCYPYTKRNTQTWYFFRDPALDPRVARYTTQVFCGLRIWEIKP